MEKALSNLSAVLKEEGILIVGVSETATVRHSSLDAKNQNDVFYFQSSNRRR
jgi:chemotaxis methyl-accepting protein methylase